MLNADARNREAKPLAQHRRTAPANARADLLPRIRPAEVREDDGFVLEALREFGDVVEVDVPVPRGALPVPFFDEAALDHQHLGAEDLVVLLEDATVGVAGIEEDRTAVLLVDLSSVAAKPGDVAPSKFVLQVVPHLDDLVRVRGNAVRSSMCADVVQPVEAHRGAVRQTGDFNVVRRAAQLFVERHQPAESIGGFFGNDHAPASEAVQTPLRGIERDAGGVIEMRVRDEDVRYADDEVGTAADVEREVEVANAEVRFVSSARTPFDREALRVDDAELVIGHSRRSSAPRRSG